MSRCQQRPTRSRPLALILAAACQVIAPTVACALPVPCAVRDNIRYVRSCTAANAAECNDANTGQSPATAWATLQRAANHLNRLGASPGEIVIVGPGVYREGNIDLRRDGSRAFPKFFVADPEGTCTGDPASAVVLDAELRFGAGFLIFGASYVTVTGFEITGARDAGIQIRRGPLGERSVGVTVANNVIYENGLTEISRGIEVTDAANTTIFNNLLYRNAGNGIGILSAPSSQIINNTIVGHPGFGVVIAQQPMSTASPTPTPTANPSNTATASPSPTATPRPSTGSWLLNNIIANNATRALPAFSIDVDRMSACDYIGAFNLISASDGRLYSGETPRDPSDILANPAFADAANDDYRVLPNSPAIDAGSDTAPHLSLSGGSVRVDGDRDMGTVDLGYHVGSDTVPMFEDVPATTQEIFVRADGDDGADGATADSALRTIAAAVDRARAVSRVIVGPGVYRETVAVSGARPAGPIELYADAQGALTRDVPGRVVVDAHHAAAGINVVEHCSTVIDGFVVTNGGDDGIRLKSAHRSTVRNNITQANDARGINVVDSEDVRVINNLSYANVGGIQIGGNSAGSPRAVIENNTVYGNTADGILIGTGPIASPGALLRFNIIDNNGQIGVQLDDNERAGRSAAGFCAEYNLVFHDDPTKRYGPIRSENCPLCLSGTAAAGSCAQPMCRVTQGQQCLLAPPDDLPVDPAFAGPVTGADGCLGGRRFWDDAFWIKPRPLSPAVDLGEFERVTARSLDLNDRATESCDVRDRDWIDAGFHALQECFTDLPSLAGDCNADNCVTVSEVITGVNIVLERQDLASCPAFDLNDDGRVTVDELVSAVNDLFCCSAVPGN